MKSTQLLLSQRSAAHVVLLTKGLALGGTPRLHLRFKVHQAESLLTPQVTGEPAGGLLAAVPPLDVVSKHSSREKK